MIYLNFINNFNFNLNQNTPFLFEKTRAILSCLYLNYSVQKNLIKRTRKISFLILFYYLYLYISSFISQLLILKFKLKEKIYDINKKKVNARKREEK